MDNILNRCDGPGEPRRLHRGSYERHQAAKRRQDKNTTPAFHADRQAVLGRGGQFWHADGLLKATGSLQKAFDVLLAAHKARKAGR